MANDSLKKVATGGIIVYFVLLAVGYIVAGSIPSLFEIFLALLMLSAYGAVIGGRRLRAPNIWFPKFQVPGFLLKMVSRRKN